MGTAARQRALSDLGCFRYERLRSESSSRFPRAISSCRTNLGALFRCVGHSSDHWTQLLGGRGSSARSQNSHPELLFMAHGFWWESECPRTSSFAEGRAVHGHRRAARERDHTLKCRRLYGSSAEP